MHKIIPIIKKQQSQIFCAATVALFILICIPLFTVAKYNYMSGDDLAFGAATHHAIQDGQPWKIFGLAATKTAELYQTWQGSFSAIFLFTLQPGIWGEQYYQLGTYIIIFSLVLMQFIYLVRLQGRKLTRTNWFTPVNLCALLCLVQIFYAPFPEECFFWFNGSLYYTFFYCLQILLFSEILFLFRFPKQLKLKHWGFLIWTLCLSAVIGGGNLATGLATALALSLLSLSLYIIKSPYRFRILAINIVNLAAFTINITAPGNALRAQSPGYHPISPISTVLLAIWHCILNIYSWTNPKMWLILLAAAPLLWKIAGTIKLNWGFTFRLPVIASSLFFCIYASQLAPITYMQGTYGPKRMGDMMWFSYVTLMFMVEGYWLGWMRCRFAKSAISNRILSFLSTWHGILQLSCLALWCVAVLFTNVKSSSTYKAWTALTSGYAQQYAVENEERLKILHDPEIKDAWLYEIKYKVEPIFMYDITESSQGISNISMADFYRKNTVNLIIE